MRTIVAHPLRLGIIFPDGRGAEEYRAYPEGAPFAVQTRIAVTPADDGLTIEDLLRVGDEERLVQGARELAPWRPGAVTWACTSGSFVVGLEGARRQVAAIGAAADAPAGSTSLAFVDAARALGLSRVAMVSPYLEEVAERLVGLLAASGVEVVALRTLDCRTTTAALALGDGQVLEAALGVDTPVADAVLLPDTALQGLRLIEPLQSRLGKVVLTANQVTLWQALRLAGCEETDPRLGALAAASLPAASGAPP